MTKKATSDAWPQEFEASVKLGHEGQADRACVLLEQLAQTADTDKRRALALRMKGGFLLHTLNRLEDAEDAFRRVLQIDTDYERASIGLFHALWSQGRFDDAFEEAKRFVLLKPSKEYRRIVAEIMEGLEE